MITTDRGRSNVVRRWLPLAFVFKLVSPAAPHAKAAALIVLKAER